jgi:copper transport protein
VCLAFASFLVLLLAAPQASAHAVVVGSDPADGARLAKAPAVVTIRFDEAVGLNLGYLRVVDSAGRRVDTGNASHPGGVGSSISVSLKSGVSDGSYLASFRVVSADSHPVGGSIRFVVGSGPLGIGGGPSGTAVTDRWVATGLAVSHWLSFAGVALVGGSWLIFTLWPAGQRRAAVRRAIWIGWASAAVAALAEFVLQGAYAAGSSLATVTQPTLLDATLHVNAGQLLSLRLVLLGVLGAVLTALLADGNRRRPSWGPEAAAIVGVGIVVTYAASGHTQSTNPRWLAVLIDSMHLTAMIVWLGGLAILVVAALSRSSADESEDDATELAAGLPIFSRVALASVATLAVTGTIQAWREVGTVDALSTTWYGRLVLAKVVLLGVLIGLGYLARRTVLRRDWAARTGPLQRMRRTLFVEVLVGATVLAVTGVLIAQPPGKVALAAERSKPKTATVAVTKQSSAQVEVSPGNHGTVEVGVELTGSITPIQVTATASLPSRQLGPIPVQLQATGPRSYTASDVLLPSAGMWEVTLTVQTSEFDSTTSVARVRIS